MSRYNPTPAQRQMQYNRTVPWVFIGVIASMIAIPIAVNETDGTGMTLFIISAALAAIWIGWVGPVIVINRLGVVDPDRARRLDMALGAIWAGRIAQNRHEEHQRQQAKQQSNLIAEAIRRAQVESAQDQQSF
jgi:hypothetical protein